MSIQPLPQPAPSWAVPIAVGALTTFLVHSLMLVVPDFMALSCCCGITGVPVGFLPAFMAMRQDPRMSAGQCFAVSFIATGIGALLVAFLIMVVQGWSVSEEVLAELRRTYEDYNREQPAGSQLSPEEIDQAVELFGRILSFAPLIASGMVILAGGLTGLVTGMLMGRRSARHPPA